LPVGQLEVRRLPARNFRRRQRLHCRERRSTPRCRGSRWGGRSWPPWSTTWPAPRPASPPASATTSAAAGPPEAWRAGEGGKCACQRATPLWAPRKESVVLA